MKKEESKFDLLSFDYEKFLDNKEQPNLYDFSRNLKKLISLSEIKHTEQLPFIPKFDLFKFVDKAKEEKKECTFKQDNINKKENNTTSVINNNSNISIQIEHNINKENNMLIKKKEEIVPILSINNNNLLNEKYNKSEIPMDTKNLKNSKVPIVEIKSDKNIQLEKIQPEPSKKNENFIDIKKSSVNSQFINSATITTLQVKEHVIHVKKIKDKLLDSANIYWSLREKMRSISNNPQYKKMIEKIELEINQIVNQLNNETDVDEKAESTKKILNEIYAEKKEDIYVFTINLICQRVILKSEKFIKEEKKNFLFLSNFLNIISQRYKLLEDFFFMIITFKCPYVIPKVFTKTDFPDKKIFMKRLGYSNSEENFITWINNMECYSYLYFTFLYHDKSNRYLIIIKDFLEDIEAIHVDPPTAVTFKAFINTLGLKICSSISGGLQILKKITLKYSKGLEELKIKSKSTDIKQISGENLHFIKKYFNTISTGGQMDIFK